MVKDFGLTIAPEELLKANNDGKEYLLSQEGYPAVPYVVDLIKNLHSHGLKLIIASSSPATSIEYVMDAHKIRDYFEGYVSGTRLQHPKPAPDIFLAAAKQLAVTPTECIVIEDSTNGVKAADAAGMTCIGFVNPNSGNQDLSKANFLVEGFDEVDYEFISSVYQEAHWQASDILTSPNLLLRELDVTDANALFDILQEDDIRKFYDDHPVSLEVEVERRKAYINNIYKIYGYGQWGIFRRDNMQLIGCCGIELRISDGVGDYELGYLISKDYRGKGYAFEASEAVIQYFYTKYEPNQKVAIIDRQNLPSLCLAEKLGMIKSAELVRNHRDCYKYILNFD
jgi:HAD superfamily hydrolase (TIGR01509 family)